MGTEDETLVHGYAHDLRVAASVNAIAGISRVCPGPSDDVRARLFDVTCWIQSNQNQIAFGI